jgi:CTP:molybdopterin cytidylyltransferase MocA
VATRPELAAVVLSAGFSRRMGSFKPLLPFGSTTVIERVIGTIRDAGVETIRVVVGWNADALTPVLDRCAAPWVRNERFADGMYASVQAGVRSLPPDVAAFFLLPGDMPLVRGGTLVRLIAEWDSRPGGVLYPCHEGRRGHPPLIASRYIPEILRETPPGGLRELLTRHAMDARNIEVSDPGILADLDTPEGYRRWSETQAQPDKPVAP